MNRRASAILSILLLLFASLMGVGQRSMPDLAESSLRVVNTSDGVSLDESVLDDLRPGGIADPSGLSPIDFGTKPIWAFLLPADGNSARPFRPLPTEHQAPWLEGLLRPPAAS